MRICVCSARSLSGSGYATRLESMLSAYVAMGHEVDLVHYRFDHEASLGEPLRGSMRRYVEVPLKPHRVLRYASLDPPLARECALAAGVPRSGRYDVVQVETSVLWRVAGSVDATHRLLVLHDDDARRLRSLAGITDRSSLRVEWGLAALQYARLQRIAIAEADRIWFVSASDRDRLAEAEATNTAVVPNGAWDDLWTVAAVDPDEAPVVLYVGAGSYEANRHGLYWFLSEVWSTIRARFPLARLRVVGSGWRDLGERTDVEFVGFRPTLRGEYEKSRVVIAPVFAGGGTNLKVVEGMAAARPVVTTAMGAHGIPAGEGRLAEDDPMRFAESVIDFVDGPLLAAQVGLANRRSVEHLRWSVIWRDAGADIDRLVTGEHAVSARPSSVR